MDGKGIIRLGSTSIISFHHRSTTSLYRGVSAIPLSNKPTASLCCTPIISLRNARTFPLCDACTIPLDNIGLYTITLYEDCLEASFDHSHHFLSLPHLDTELAVLADLLLDLHL